MAYKHIFVVADGTPGFPLIAANGNYPSDNGFLYSGGTGTLEVMGTFGGGTAKLQMRGIDGVTWLDIGSATSFTAAGISGFVVGNRLLRVNVAGATSPSLYCAITKVVGD